MSCCWVPGSTGPPGHEEIFQLVLHGHPLVRHSRQIQGKGPHQGVHRAECSINSWQALPLQLRVQICYVRSWGRCFQPPSLSALPSRQSVLLDSHSKLHCPQGSRKQSQLALVGSKQAPLCSKTLVVPARCQVMIQFPIDSSYHQSLWGSKECPRAGSRE